MITTYETYVKDFAHVAELLDFEGMKIRDIARVFLVYVIQREEHAEKNND